MGELLEFYLLQETLMATSRNIVQIGQQFIKMERHSLIKSISLQLPITEELYFRGYLFHRLPENIKNKWMVGALLFAVYHFWQPWNYASLFLISLVLVAPVVKFNNVYLSIAIHMIANIIGTILFFGQINQL